MQTDLTPTQSILKQLTLPTNYIENKNIGKLKVRQFTYYTFHGETVKSLEKQENWRHIEVTFL